MEYQSKDSYMKSKDLAELLRSSIVTIKYSEVNDDIRSVRLTLLGSHTAKDRKGGDRSPLSANSISNIRSGEWFTAWDVDGSRWKNIRYDRVMLINGRKTEGVAFNGGFSQHD
jgi:hypothetical protein